MRRVVLALRARHQRDGVRGGVAPVRRARARAAARRLPRAPRGHAAAPGLRRAPHQEGRVSVLWLS